VNPFYAATLSIFLVGACNVVSADLAPPPAMVLTNVAEILHLSAAQAALGIPVHVQGVVVDESEPREHAVILQGQGTGIYLFSETNLFAPFHRRDVLAVEGVTSKGQFAPCVIITKAKKIGWRETIAAQPVTYQQLVSGALDAQYVQIAGVVRQCRPTLPSADNNNWRMVLDVDGGTVLVRIPGAQDPQIDEDAEVSIEAVCLYQFNQKRQALSPILAIPTGESVTVIKDSPTNPFAAPLRSSASLLQYSPDGAGGHRVHVRGTVISSSPSLTFQIRNQSTGLASSSDYQEEADTVWIRDEATGLRIQIRQTTELQPGDEIEALGFPGRIYSNPVLEDAIYRKVGKSSPPAPINLTNISNVFNCQDDLVSITAKLTDIQPAIDGLILTLEKNRTVFKAILKHPPNPNSQSGWPVGSQVCVVGICSVSYDSFQPEIGFWHPQSFQILLRSPADLTILKFPSWWTTKHVVILLGIIVTGLLIFSGVFMFYARRRLNEQTHRRATAEAEFAAILNERNRLAREIHDTLAQGLTATSVQLQLAKVNLSDAADATHQHLDMAQQLVRGSLEEARNSIWNMRPQVLETGDLATALKNILTQLSKGVVAETRFDVVGRNRRLPAVVENNVLRLGQEAITNAVNHARAKKINVRLEFDPKHFFLTVIDDGRGFDSANPPPSSGGFGLVAMHARAKELNGKLEIRSTANQGTTVSLSLPLMGD